SPSAIDPGNDKPRVEVIAHRGASGDAPENTFAAFELALAQGADGIEFDVHLTRDDVPVVLHDARLERTTSGSGRIRNRTVAALAGLDAGSWFNRRFPEKARAEFAACRIPRLDEVLNWVRERNVHAYLEIKQTRPRYHGIEAEVLREIYRAGAQQKVTVISFHLPTLRRIRRLDSRIVLGIDFMRPLLAITRAQILGAGTLLPHWRSARRWWIVRAHRAGLKVIIWGLDDPRWMRRRIADGVDGIITTFPGELRKIQNDL
ncbi:MAG: glycerophosphodiester phosphodiesterase, partial [Deltaproteobacteria bacterium]